MLRGKQAAFLSCSHKYKEQVAWRFRAALAEAGILGIIVEDLPRLGTAWTADQKVDEYLRVADAFVALCTPDDQHGDGTWWPRENIPEEVARARAMPHLEHKVAVIKAAEVRLPSNLVAVYDHMSPEDPAPAIRSLFEQLRVWHFDIPDTPAPLVTSTDELRKAAHHAPLLALFRLGDEEGNRRRIRWWMASHTKPEQERAVEQVLDIVRDTQHWTAAENAAFVLDYLAALDLGLFPAGLLDELSRNPDFTVRSVAASILWTAATISPGVTPLDIIMRLVVKGEDWYVVRPAQRALQQLALTRVDAMQVLIDLAQDDDRDHRVFATKAFADIAGIRPASVPRSVVETLAQEADVEIRDDARRALAQMPDDLGNNWQWEFGEFSAF